MKAAVLYANDDIRYEDFKTPDVVPGSVKIKIRATGICGSDVPRVLHNGAHFYPIVLGHEFAGEVVELGEGVTSLQVGDRVTGAPILPCMTCSDCLTGNYSLCKKYSFVGSRQNGTFAEYVVLPEKNTVKFENTVSFTEAAFFEPSTVALHGIFLNNFSGGREVAILGGGTIGLFTAMWCKLLGARRVTVFDISNERLALAKKLGIDETVNTLDTDYMDKVKDMTKGRGFDDVFETAGAVPTMQLAFEIAANKAKVCFIGTPHVDLTFTPKQWENMNRKEFKLTGSWMSYSAPFPGKEWEMTSSYLSNGKLKVVEELIFKKYPLSQAAEAFQLFKNPKDVKGKVMLIND